MKHLYRFANWLPLLATALPISLLLMGAGENGQKQYPAIHGWVSTDFFRELYYPWLMKFLPFAFYAIYAALFFQKRIARTEIIVSMIFYTLFIGGFLFFAFLMSGLASQGAGL